MNHVDCALKLKALGKDVAMFVTPPSDEMVRKAGIACVTASEDGRRSLNMNEHECR